MKKEKQMNKLKRLFLNIWSKIIGSNNTEKKIDENQVDLDLQKKIKGIFRSYFDNHPSLSLLNLGVTNISFIKEDDKVVMNITLEKPGVLIGKQGSTIDKIINIIKRTIKQDFAIKITESNLWS